MKKQIITALVFTTILTTKSFAQWGVGTMNTPIQTTNGYVGIGTAAPAAKLTIWDSNNTSDETQMIRLGYSSSYDYRIFRQKNDGILRFDGNQVTYSGFRFSTPAAAYGLVISNSGNVGIGFQTPRAKLDVNGKVIIGTTTQTGTHSNAMLTVDGKIVSKELVITLNNWADYVFEKGYKLPNLYDIEKYYLANKHLPEIPSEKEVIENGVSMGEMNTLLLKKIEELTLYMVEQNKKTESQQLMIENLSKEIKTLKEK